VTSQQIRSEFLRFFEARGHRVVPSHGLIPPADPTLLFVNAGMVQFKDVFTGRRDPGYRRATTTQKCLRVSGKHNDLEQVGRTPRHHTFFEMLGNFSFGDYFKAEACRFAWDLLTGVYGLDPKDLWVTVHPDDDEARTIWTRDVGVAPDRVLADPSNFWSMGDTGPCGPCSEIHIDRGPSYPGVSMADPGHRFMELWNLVFMQYDRDGEGRLTPLPAPSIDTGMGLERICSVIQGVRSNYETDLFRPLMDRAAALAGTAYGRDEEGDTALRVIADHARATAFLIADGIYPENEGRGYVLRRLMRRALRFGHKMGLRQPFFTEVVLAVEAVMGEAWPELAAHREVIRKVAAQEEDRFLRTLASGMEMLEQAIGRVRESGSQRLDGETVFTLYDTHGFPADLTALVAEEHGLGIDEEGFAARMEQQRERGRASWKGAAEDLAPVVEECRARGWTSAFVGHDWDEGTGQEVPSTIRGIFADGVPVEEAREGQSVILVVSETPFYGESGGQVGDRGRIRGEGVRVQVQDTRRPQEDLILHLGHVEAGSLRIGDRVLLAPDPARRRTRRNHSATHLLHRALREVLGGHVRQRGSLVTPDRLRFDFSHPGPMTPEELRAVEDHVQRAIFDDLPVTTEVLPLQEAVDRGALHFFGDKYGDVVRMVRMGESRELCGGTHVRRTGEIGVFVILSEGGISAGVRRIEALTGEAAVEWLRQRADWIGRLSEALKVDGPGILDRVQRLLAEEKALRKEVSELKVKAAAGASGTGGSGGVREVGGIRVQVASADGVDPKAARDLADTLRERLGSGIVLLTRVDGDRLAVMLAVTKNLSDRYPAGRVLQAVLSPLEGRGGGNPLLAQGSVPDREGAARVLDALLRHLSS